MTDELELRSKINEYRTRELQGERLPRDEFEKYISLKRELYYFEARQRAKANSEFSVKIGQKPMIMREGDKSRLKLLLDRFRGYK